MTAQTKYIDFGDDDHISIMGQTRSGKTTGALRSLEKLKQGVLFFNTQQIEFPKVWIKANKENEMISIVGALRQGKKVVYNPSREYRQQEIAILIRKLYEASEGQLLDIFLVVDEVHLFTKQALTSCEEVATTGIRWGIKMVSISQRPAKISNTILTQSTRFIFYEISSMERNYLEGYRIPFQSIYDGLTAGGKYSYMVFDGRNVEGAYKVT
jgi:hypothetical protein